MLEINQSYPCLSHNHGGARNASSIKYIVLHYTGNSKDAAINNAKYFHNNALKNKASAHYFVDNDSIYQSVQDNVIAYSVGGSTQSSHHPLYKVCTNTNSISVEMCTSGDYEVSEATENNAVELVKYLMNKYSVGVDNVIRHYDVNGKACPCSSFRTGNRWNNFKVKLGASAGSVTPSQPTPTPTSPASKGDSIIEAGQQHSINFTGYSIATDGIYGTNTKKNGVRCLQTAINLDYHKSLAIDGIAGNSTKGALGNHYVKKGEKQYLVTAVEILLMLKGYNAGGVECPGIFGSGLENAVKQYQKDHGLTADGVAGRKTILSLIS